MVLYTTLCDIMYLCYRFFYSREVCDTSIVQLTMHGFTKLHNIYDVVVRTPLRALWLVYTCDARGCAVPEGRVCMHKPYHSEEVL